MIKNKEPIVSIFYNPIRRGKQPKGVPLPNRLNPDKSPLSGKTLVCLDIECDDGVLDRIGAEF